MSSKFYAQPVMEQALWEDRRRRLPFGWPLSFTKYIMTDVRLKINNGFLKRREDTIQLYRITDATLTRTIGERLCRTGTITVVSSDASTPVVRLRHVKHPVKVRDLLLQSIESARKAAGVSTAEIVGGAAAGRPVPPTHGLTPPSGTTPPPGATPPGATPPPPGGAPQGGAK